MGTQIYQIVNEIVDTLEKYGHDPLPSNERTGSMWFKESQEIVYNRQMPKGKVYFDTMIPDERTHGSNFTELKTYILNCVFFTKKSDKCQTTNKKDRELVQYMLQNIEDTLKTHKIPSATLIGFGEVDGPIPYDKTNNVFVGVKPVTYVKRE